ncbi:MAG: DUF4131 domain-containing protein [Butyrivibrio sp.]|nr:DUF4131 domain-containing protein [Butyrivibrio sp.]
MKRPLCVVALVFAAAIWIFLKVIPSGESSNVPDQANITCIGRVTGIEIKENVYTGEEESVVYLKQLEEDTTVLAYFSPVVEPEIGKVIKVTGNCKQFRSATNPGEFDSKNYYRILRIAYQIKGAKIVAEGGKADFIKNTVYGFKRSCERTLDSCLNAEDAGVMKAVLLGDKGDLDDEIKDIYKRNGIIHIIAVSGLHISILGLSLYKLFRKASLWVIPSAAISISVMYLYGIMCGMSTSAFRAIVMFSVRLLADVIGRTYDMLSALALAAILLLIEQPLYIRHSGFLMSFGAVLALGYVLPAFPEAIRNGPLKIVMGSFSISLMTFPVYTSFYYTFPIVSFVLNLFVLPLMSVLMFSGLLCLFLGGIVLPLGCLVGVLCHLVLRWFSICCQAGDMIPYGTWYIGHSEEWQIVVCLFFLAMFVMLGEGGCLRKSATRIIKNFVRQPNERSRQKPLQRHSNDKNDKRHCENIITVIQSLILGLGIIILCFRYHPDLKITAVDVGQGDGIIIETKKSRIMIDGGSTSKKNVAKYQIVPFLSYEGIGALDAVILTHEDEDHMSGILEMMDMMEERRSNIRIKNLILPDINETSKGENYRKLVKRAEELKIPVSYIKQGDELIIAGIHGTGRFAKQGISDKGMMLKCIGPVSGMITDEPNAYSTILLLKYGGFSALFTGDVESTGQDNLKDYIKKYPTEFENLTLLKVAHHGSEYTTDEEFLELIRPRISLISCGLDNRYGHPHKELLNRLEAINTSIYRTDQSGAITVVANGNNVQMSTFK